MKVISGTLKGRNIGGYNIEGTRPTMDRVKESIFGSIQTKIKNSVCLDLFCGSGSIGLEFISNGAAKTYFVDNNIIVTKKLKELLNKIKVDEEYYIYNSDYKKMLKEFSGKVKFDIIFLDPPYDYKILSKCLKYIYELNLLNDNGIVILEYENEHIDTTNYNEIKDKKYGSKYVKIVEKI